MILPVPLPAAQRILDQIRAALASAGEAQRAETVEQAPLVSGATAKPGRPFNASDARQLRKLEHEAELRWRYGVRHENEPRIRELEQILGKRAA